MAKGDCVRCTHCVVCKYRSSNEQLWIKEHCKLAARDERPRGRWENDRLEKNSLHVGDCSKCGEKGVIGNFCPNCGASMSANDRQVTGKLNSEIENSKSEIVPDYRDGWSLKEAEAKKCPNCGSDLYEYCFMCCYEGEKVIGMTNEEALNAITAFVENYACGSDLDGLREAIEALKDRPHGEWIPCSERLPEKSGQYYVSGGGKVWVCNFLIIPDFKGGWCNDVSNPVVKAWMPMPEPYKKEGDENG